MMKHETGPTTPEAILKNLHYIIDDMEEGTLPKGKKKKNEKRQSWAVKYKFFPKKKGQN